MRIHGADLISRATQNSTRLLFLLSGSLIAVDRYGLNQENWAILGENRTISPEQFSEIGLVLLAFGVFSHLAHWYPDYVAFTKWFKKNEVPIDRWFEQSAKERTEPVVVSIHHSLTRISQEDFPNLSKSGVEDLLAGFKNIEKLLKDVGPNFRSMKWTSRFVVFGWYLIFPLLLAFWAFFVTFHVC